jgi:predicted MFS family arabinose efflux permease
MDSQKRYPPNALAWSVWGMGALLYVTGFYQRVAPAVMTTELMKDFQISAKALGNLSAFYYYSYVAMQVPTGLLVDSLGSKKLLTFGAMAAALGTFIFAIASSFSLACLGRAIVGGSVAVAWVVMLKLASHWFPPRRYAMVSGVALCFGVLGALSAGVPLRILIDHFGWRTVMEVSAGITLLIAIAAKIVVNDNPSTRGFVSYAPAAVDRPGQARRSHPFKGLIEVFAYRNTWLLFFAPGGLIGPVLAFAGLWGVPFMKVRYGLPPAEAAAVCSVMMLCWAIGGPISGGLSDKIGQRKPLYLAGCVVAAAGWVTMFFVRGLPLQVFIGVTALTGFANGAVIIGFAYSKESVPIHLAGTVSGMINTGHMIGPALLQPGIGWILDRTWSGDMVEGLRIYGLSAFETGFLLIIGWSILACVLVGFTKETHCKQSA